MLSVQYRNKPPAAIRTVRDLFYWQYAKIIAGSSGMGKKNWGFVMSRYKKLQQKEVLWDEIREYVKERESSDECIFCGSKSPLTVEHLFPRSLNGPDTEKNIIWICQKCNSRKGSKRLYEKWTLDEGLKGAKYNVPRVAEGKYLKLLYEELGKNGMLDIGKGELKDKACPWCDLSSLCENEDSVGKLSPLCLDGLAKMCFSGFWRENC